MVALVFQCTSQKTKSWNVSIEEKTLKQEERLKFVKADHRQASVLLKLSLILLVFSHSPGLMKTNATAFWEYLGFR